MAKRARFLNLTHLEVTYQPPFFNMATHPQFLNLSLNTAILAARPLLNFKPNLVLYVPRLRHF